MAKKNSCDLTNVDYLVIEVKGEPNFGAGDFKTASPVFLDPGLVPLALRMEMKDNSNLAEELNYITPEELQLCIAETVLEGEFERKQPSLN